MDIQHIPDGVPYTEITLHHNLNFLSLPGGFRVAGTYRHIGDFRPCVRNATDLRNIQSGFVELKYIDPAVTPAVVEEAVAPVVEEAAAPVVTETAEDDVVIEDIDHDAVVEVTK